jgi:hypothetical protein
MAADIRALAARLNARVSELVLSEQRADAAAQAASKRCSEMQAAHETRLSALLEQLHAQRKARAAAAQVLHCSAVVCF